MQEITRPKATGVRGEPTAACGAALIATQRAPLSVIEDVERFRPEFEGDILPDKEVFEYCHVDVPMAWIA